MQVSRIHFQVDRAKYELKEAVPVATELLVSLPYGKPMVEAEVPRWIDVAVEISGCKTEVAAAVVVAKEVDVELLGGYPEAKVKKIVVQKKKIDLDLLGGYSEAAVERVY